MLYVFHFDLNEFRSVLKKAALENGQYETVEGYVEKFHAMPPEGHDSEHFVIDGVYFQYTAFEERNGYHRPACQGGVITNDGQYLKIGYVTNKKGENVILSIEALDPSK